MWKTDYIYRNDTAKNLPIFKSELWFTSNDVANKGIFQPVTFILEIESFEGFQRVNIKNF